MKDEVRKDSATAQLHIIRLIFSLFFIMGFGNCVIDVKGAYLQIGYITRKIYVRPPSDIHGTSGNLWFLTRIPYFITEAGIQWQKLIEKWIIDDAVFQRAYGVSQLFVERYAKVNIIILVSKITDYILMGGITTHMNTFTERIKKRFEISKVIIDGIIHFNGCKLKQVTDVVI